MGDRLLEGRAAKGLVARLAPPFDREVVEAGLGEMMGDELRLGRGALGLIAQDFGGAAVQRLAATLEQAVVGRVLDQRVLEAIVRLMARALGDEEVRAGEPVERGLEGWVVDLADSAEQRVGEISPQDGADLRDFARFAEPVEPRRERLLKRRRDRLQAAGLAALEQKARDFLDEQRHPAGALAHALDHLSAQRMASGELADHKRDVGAIEGAKRDHAVVRAQAPGRAEFGPRGREDEQRRLRAALGEGLHQIERGRIGPVQILERERDRLRARPGEKPCRQRRQLPAAQFLRREFRRALLRQRDVDQRREQGRIFGEVEADEPKRVLEVGEASVGRLIRAEALSAPFGDRVQRRILQELRRRQFDKGVGRLAKRRAKLLHETRLADAGFADNECELARAIARPLPAPAQQCRAPPRARRAGVRARAPVRLPPLARTMR